MVRSYALNCKDMILFLNKINEYMIFLPVMTGQGETGISNEWQ